MDMTELNVTVPIFYYNQLHEAKVRMDIIETLFRAEGKRFVDPQALGVLLGVEMEDEGDGA